MDGLINSSLVSKIFMYKIIATSTTRGGWLLFLYPRAYITGFHGRFAFVYLPN